MKKIKIIVTGGSGFIGTNMMSYLLRKGYNVINIDKQRPKNATHLPYWKEVNILDKNILEKTILDFSPDYIIHLAARCDLKGKTLNDYNENIDGVNNLLEICKNPNLALKKVLITSSMLVCNPEYKAKNQKDYCPHTPYGESKVLTEKLTWEQNLSCDWAIIRPTSIWGPWFDEPYRNFFDMIIKGFYFHIGYTHVKLTYGYVGNIVKQIESILFSDTTALNNKVFYLGDYEITVLDEWADEIASELKKKIIHVPYFIVKCGAIFGDLLKIFQISFPLTSFRLKNMITDNVVDLSNTQKLCPNLPYTRKQAVHRTLQWIKRNYK